jgi:hypothetical protein
MIAGEGFECKMLIETGSKLLMIVDSITDSDKAQPVGGGLFATGGRVCWPDFITGYGLFM